jgi:F-type H+-transporting ATPase subunit b
METNRMNSKKLSIAALGLAAVIVLLASYALASEGGGADRSADLLDLLYRWINFALLVIILVVVLRKVPIKEYFSSRIQRIQKELEDLKTQKESTQRKAQELESKLRAFEGERKEIMEHYRAEGLAEMERILAEARDRAKQILEQAEVSIQYEMQTAKEKLKEEVVALAAQKAEEIIAREMTDKDQDRLVNDFIEKLGKTH